MRKFNCWLFSLLILGSCNQPAETNNSTKSKSSSSENITFELSELGVMCGEVYSDLEWYTSNKNAPILDGLDVLDYKITTTNTEAQKYFNQGLLLAYGFNHAEAARSFFQASRLDPECAMCYWGFAYVLGPNYNGGMEEDNFERAFEAIQKADALSENCTAKEKALINAMSKRYALPAPEDRSHLDQAYSDALAEVYKDFSKDPEIAALYAESLMNLHPWDLYDHDGNAKPWTAGILEALDRVLDLNPKHPGAHHFYIHAVEASKTPEKGYASAKAFDDGLVPGSGHLVHMPSHIYIRTGDYAKGLEANIKAVSVDSNYMEQCRAQGAYPLAYYPHNIHFIAATAMYAGNSHWAAKGANSLSEHANRELMKEPGWGTLQHFYSMPYYIAVKFARWDEILKMNNFDTSLRYPEAVRHFARGMAFIGLDKMKEAEAELTSLKEYEADTSLEEVSIWGINNVYTLVQIARRVLEGEINAKNKNYEKSIALLREAVTFEDGLQYQEPTDWLLPVRHHLGAVLMDAGIAKEAIQIYKEDLIKLPRNGWALKGLQEAYKSLELYDQAGLLDDQIELAWSSANIELTGSRIW